MHDNMHDKKQTKNKNSYTSHNSNPDNGQKDEYDSDDFFINFTLGSANIQIGDKDLQPPSLQVRFVYVIGLHAVQFGNNWMRQIPRTALSNLAVGGIFLIQLFPNWTSMLSCYLLIIEHPKTVCSKLN